MDRTNQLEDERRKRKEPKTAFHITGNIKKLKVKVKQTPMSQANPLDFIQIIPIRPLIKIDW